MKRYAIELNAKLVKITDSLKTAERWYNDYCEKYIAEENVVRLWDREEGVIATNQEE